MFFVYIFVMHCFAISGLYSIGSSLPSVENVDKLSDHGLPPSVNSIVEGYIFLLSCARS